MALLLIRAELVVVVPAASRTGPELHTYVH